MKYLLCFLASFCFFPFLGKSQIVDSTKNERPSVALVLSGGGAKGFAHVGVLKVIEELDIPIDYIVGTSMGSIVGGFYATGYSAAEIEQLIRAQEWEEVLSDGSSRKYVPINTKRETDRYILSFPIKQGVKLPLGIIHGQNIINIFADYTQDFHDVTDFSQLPIPFSCVAADIENGEEVHLEHGFLSDAMRASMAIPSVFTPGEIDGKLLIDGGVLNNFPADIAKNKGFNYIIGVDVQSPLRKRNELESATDVVNQLISLMGKEKNDNNIPLCDVYITPNIRGYSAASFDGIDSLLAIGNRAGRDAYDELKKLKEKIGDRGLKKIPSPKSPQTLRIKHIEVSGLNRTTEKSFKQKLRIDLPENLTNDELKKRIADVRSSLNFNLLTYKLKGPQKDTIEFLVDEKEVNRFNFGVNYNSDNDASVLLNTTFYNKLLKNSRASFDVVLSQNPRFTSRYELKLGNIPRFNFMFDTRKYELEFYTQDSREGNAEIYYAKFDLNSQFVLWDSYSGGLGARADYYDISNTNNLQESPSEKGNDWFINYYAFLRLNTFDRPHYPRKGGFFNTELRYLNNRGRENWGVIAYIEGKKAFQLNQKMAFIPSLQGRSLLKDNLPLIYDNFWGGINQTDYYEKHLNFMGTRWVQNTSIENTNMAIVRADVRYEMWRNNFLILTGNYGLFASELDEMLNSGESVFGLGATFSYNSLIGPIELTVMHSDETKKPSFFINIGYAF